MTPWTKLSSDPCWTAPAMKQRWTDDGKAFQSRAVATGKARSPSVTRLDQCRRRSRPESSKLLNIGGLAENLGKIRRRCTTVYHSSWRPIKSAWRARIPRRSAVNLLHITYTYMYTHTYIHTCIRTYGRTELRVAICHLAAGGDN